MPTPEESAQNIRNRLIAAELDDSLLYSDKLQARVWSLHEAEISGNEAMKRIMHNLVEDQLLAEQEEQ